MGWRQRLHELVLAGGSLAAVSCGGVGIPGGRCNANPDPCCLDSKSAACTAYTACAAVGGQLEGTVCVTPDAGMPDLVSVGDLPVDASHD